METKGIYGIYGGIMERRKKEKNSYKSFLGKKRKRIIVVILSILMITSVVDYSELIVSAQTLSDTKTITSVVELTNQISTNEVETLTSTPDGAIASVTIPGSEPVSYTDFATALSAAQSNSGSTLTLLKDVERGDQTIVVASGKTMTIDTNGYTLSFYLGEEEKGISVEEGATFTLRGNSSQSATVRGTPAIKVTTKSWGYWTYPVYTKGTCTIESAYIEGNDGAGRGVVTEGGSLTVKNSTIKGGTFSIWNRSGEVYFDALTTLEGQLNLKGRATVNSGASITLNNDWLGYFNTFFVNGTIGGNFTWNPFIDADSKMITTAFTADDIQITDSNGNSFPMAYTGNAIETKVFTQTITDRDGLTKEVIVDPDTYTQTFEKQGIDSNWSEVTGVKDVGTYRVKYVSDDSVIAKEFTVTPTDLSGATVELIIPEGGYTYDTTEKTPGVTVTLDGNIIDSSQYDISYSNTNGGEGNHTNAGTVTVTITGKNNYTGTTSTTFSISKKALVVKADDKQNILAGAAMPQLTYSVTGLVDGDTFTGPKIVTTATNTNTAGTYEIKISGGTLTNAENYKVIYTTGKLTVVKADITNATVSGISSVNYTGKAITQSNLVVKMGSKVLKNGTDYTVSYNNNKNIGTATVIITGKGIYTGIIKKDFKIKVSSGAIYIIGNMVYKITSLDTKGNGCVTLVKSTKSKSKLKGTVKIGNTVKIGGKSFKITALNAKAFNGYTKITKIIIGKNVTTIGKEAFSGCSKVTSVTIGTGLKTISNNAFYKCKELKTITINSKQLKTVGKNAIKNTYGSAVIEVPLSKVNAYKKLFKSKTGFTGSKKIKKK